MFFKKRKSRKQLLQEIEQLKNEAAVQIKYHNQFIDTIEKSIKTIGATCISKDNNEAVRGRVRIQLCNMLAEEIMPYVDFKEYAQVNEQWVEWKYTATIKIVEQ